MSKVQVGDRAPEFSAITYDGAAVKLSDFLGQRALILFFYPKDGTSICTKEACSFRDSYEKFVEAGAQVIGVSGDSDAAHRAFAQQHRLPFPLIADSEWIASQAIWSAPDLGTVSGTSDVCDR